VSTIQNTMFGGAAGGASEQLPIRQSRESKPESDRETDRDGRRPPIGEADMKTHGVDAPQLVGFGRGASPSQPQGTEEGRRREEE